MTFYFQTLKGHITVDKLEFNSQLKSIETLTTSAEESIKHNISRNVHVGALTVIDLCRKQSESITVLVSIYCCFAYWQQLKH